MYIDYQVVTSLSAPAYKPPVFMFPNIGLEYVDKETYVYITVIFVIGYFAVGLRIYKL